MIKPAGTPGGNQGKKPEMTASFNRPNHLRFPNFAAAIAFFLFLSGMTLPVPAQEAAPSQEREWRLLDGKTFLGTFENFDAGSNTVRILVQGKRYELRAADLSSEDREYLRSLTPEPAVEAEPEPETPNVEFAVTVNEDFNTPGTHPGQRRIMTVNGVEFRFCWCPPGTFMMGSPEDEENHENFETLHEVTLTRGFWILESEVTQQFWRLVTGRTVKDELRLHQPNVGGVFEVDVIKKVDRLGFGNDYPVYFISWTEAADFCAALSEKSGLAVALPTEAQWEYACRAGTQGPFATTEIEETVLDSSGQETTRVTMTDPVDLCWFIQNSKDGIQPVKERQPNAWGIYDMHGNVAEMCADKYSKDYYAVSPPEDPEGPNRGEYRVNRGGCWYSYLKFCRSASRFRNAEDYRYDDLGFRIVINPAPRK